MEKADQNQVDASLAVGAAGERSSQELPRTVGAVPAASWQVVFDDALRISLVGLSEGFPIDRVAADVRARLISLGAAPVAITIERVDAPARGATGKAPLIQRRANGSAAECAG